MGTPAVSTERRKAGEYVQMRADRYRRQLGAAILGSLLVTGLAFLLLGGHGPLLIGIEAVALAGLLIAQRVLEPKADRWARGAQGERKVGTILEGIGPEWHVLHDISLGRGNIDHVVVGPGGTFTVETKSHPGRISVARLDEAMLRQAYAERKVLERVTGLKVEPLLVFSEAWLIGSLPAHRRGVTVLPARMLAGYLERRRPKLGTDEAAAIASRLRLALEVDAGVS
jgi:hypothetical protein